MRTDKLNNKHILADEGKVLRRISDGQLFGNEIYLGYTYYLSGEELTEPLLELPEIGRASCRERVLAHV